MSSKSRKSLSTLTTCDKCQSIYMQKDLPLHEQNCPPTLETWNHNFIHNEVLYGTAEVYKSQETPKNISERELNDMVFVAQCTMQSCKMAIGDPVIIAGKENFVIKTVWPSCDKTLVSISLTKAAIELNNLQGPVKVQRLNHNIGKVLIAKEFVIQPMGKYTSCETNAEIDVILKNYNEQKIFCIGNKISIPYYGRKLVYKIVQCKAEGSDFALDTTITNFIDAFKHLSLESDSENHVKLYKAVYSTKWTLLMDKQENEVGKTKGKYKIEDIGGYSSLMQDVVDVLDIGLGKCRNIGNFIVSKGVLLYGTAGVGKSMIANALISAYNVNTFTVHSSDIYSKSVGETEEKLKNIFIDARAKAPSIILLDDIDTLCPKRSTSSTDHERRVLATLVSLFDELQSTNENVAVIATTSKLDFVDSSLRRPGRIDKEFEVYVPSPQMRTAILTKLLSKIPNTLSEEDISNISFATHGFVGADLYGLCSQAIISRIKKQQKIDIGKDEPKVTISDFNYALTVTKPSAMKEVLVEVPNVKWTDIGGQNELKLKLKQAVEWPLRHPEAFIRMGITPPRGVLMFGPPGCSKTMIAKALATESKVNFLNIKGPELFSKWVGESEKAVREVFRKARQVAPSIIFIDEIDALGGERASPSGGSGSNVQERVLAQLLTELDGVTALGNVTLVAATNRPDKIDKALLRPGRLDRIIYVPLPDYETRQEIFTIKLKNMPIAEDVNTQDLVDLTEGYSGAEIQAICHEAAMKALEEDLDAAVITKEHFKTALSVVTPRTPTALVKLYNDYMNKIH